MKVRVTYKGAGASQYLLNRAILDASRALNAASAIAIYCEAARAFVRTAAAHFKVCDLHL